MRQSIFHKLLYFFSYDPGNSLLAFHNSLVIADTPKISKHIEELIVFEQVVRVFWLTKPGLINDKCLIDDHPPGTETSFDLWDKRSLEIVKALPLGSRSICSTRN
jgi:hypothetical protein